MKQIKTLLTTIAVLLCCGTINAYDLEVDGIYYNIDKETGNSLKVAGVNSGMFDNEVLIPSKYPASYNSLFTPKTPESIAKNPIPIEPQSVTIIIIGIKKGGFTPPFLITA